MTTEAIAQVKPLDRARLMPRHQLEAENVALLAQVTELQKRGTAFLSIERLANEAGRELARAREKFPRQQASAHEGFAVLAEEVDELWDLVKLNPKKAGLSDDEYRAKMRAEAIQVAAMALRFVQDVCDGVGR